MLTRTAAAEKLFGFRFPILGVRGRLLLAFIGITTFAVMAEVAAIVGFHHVGGRLQVVDSRLPPTLAALDLARSAARISAAAPMLLTAPESRRRDEIKSELAGEVQALNAAVEDLRRRGVPPHPLQNVERLSVALIAGLEKLDALAERRIETAARIARQRDAVLEANAELHRLLSPWAEVVAAEISALAATEPPPSATAEGAERLKALILMQQSIEQAKRQQSSTVGLLTAALTEEQQARLPVIAFQIDRALRALEASAAPLDLRLRPLVLEQIARLRGLAEGDDGVTALRERELELVDEGGAVLESSSALSSELAEAVDDLAVLAKTDVGGAIEDVLWSQKINTHALSALVVLSVASSVLIVWLYVGGNIVRRLTALSDGMLAIAAGRLQTPMTIRGGDEIAAMGDAVEVFRRNTLERDWLLSEQSRAAEVLEEEVRQRTEELARSVREIEEKRRQLEEANRYKSHFLASASHDLRQPLHALNLFIDQLRSETEVAERARLIGRIDTAVDSMNEMFEVLLDMSKLEAGIIVPEVTAFPLSPLLERVETSFGHSARSKGIRLMVAPTSAWVRSDFILLERILFNLVSNAVRYTEQGGVVVGIRHRDAQLRIDVCDSGPGIPEEKHHDVFGEFYRMPGLKTGGGFGLGLAIVERLGRLLDHHVELVSEAGRGSRFSVWVPGAQPETAVLAAATVPEDPLKDRQVLVVEDDPAVAEAMGGLLSRWGCRVACVRTSGEALAAAGAPGAQFDLIIADYQLGGCETGIGVIHSVRGAAQSQVPAVLVSGDTQPERLREATEQGFHILHKPVPPMRLRAMLHHLLKGPAGSDPERPAARPTAPTAVRGPAPSPR